LYTSTDRESRADLCEMLDEQREPFVRIDRSQ